MTDPTPARRIYHFARADAWQAAQATGRYRPAEFDRDGFIHCATAAQIAGVVQRHLRGGGPRLKLTLDVDALGEALVYEWSDASNDLYPHLFGALPLNAVVAVEAFDPEQG